MIYQLKKIILDVVLNFLRGKTFHARSSHPRVAWCRGVPYSSVARRSPSADRGSSPDIREVDSDAALGATNVPLASPDHCVFTVDLFPHHVWGVGMVPRRPEPSAH